MENEMAQNHPKKKKKIWLWILLSLIAGSVVGVGITCGNVFFMRGSMDQGIYQIGKENGYSGNSGQKMVSLLQTDEAIAEVSEKSQGSIVTVVVRKVIQSTGGNRTSTGLGSGVVFREDDKNYYVLTNAHVVNGTDTIMLYYSDEELVKADLVGQDIQSDIAVLKIEKETIPESVLKKIKCASFGDSDNLRIGETAIVIGSPQGLEFSYSVSVGVISGTHRQVEVEGIMMTYMQTDAAINPGNSGGALLNTAGEVIGITSAKMASDDVEGIGFAIPINTALEVAQKLMDNGFVEWLSLGLEEYDFLSQAIAEAYHVPAGIVVYKTTKGGPAANAGLQRGDIITEIDGKVLETAVTVREILDGYKAGDHVKLTVIRNRNTENPLTLEAVLMTESEIAQLQERPNFWGDR